MSTSHRLHFPHAIERNLLLCVGLSPSSSGKSMITLAEINQATSGTIWGALLASGNASIQQRGKTLSGRCGRCCGIGFLHNSRVVSPHSYIISDKSLFRMSRGTAYLRKVASPLSKESIHKKPPLKSWPSDSRHANHEALQGIFLKIYIYQNMKVSSHKVNLWPHWFPWKGCNILTRRCKYSWLLTMLSCWCWSFADTVWNSSTWRATRATFLLPLGRVVG